MFHQFLEGVVLPSSLQTLTFGDQFNQSLGSCLLPSQLRTLTLGSVFPRMDLITILNLCARLTSLRMQAREPLYCLYGGAERDLHCFLVPSPILRKVQPELGGRPAAKQLKDLDLWPQLRPVLGRAAAAEQPRDFDLRTRVRSKPRRSECLLCLGFRV